MVRQKLPWEQIRWRSSIITTNCGTCQCLSVERRLNTVKDRLGHEQTVAASTQRRSCCRAARATESGVYRRYSSCCCGGRGAENQGQPPFNTCPPPTPQTPCCSSLTCRTLVSSAEWNLMFAVFLLRLLQWFFAHFKHCVFSHFIMFFRFYLSVITHFTMLVVKLISHWLHLIILITITHFNFFTH